MNVENTNKPIYNRVVLKLSGEALAGRAGHGFDYDILNDISDEVIEINNLGVQVAIVVGGGNIWRGRSGVGMDRSTADYMGMLATVINALAMQDALEKKGMQTRVQTAIEMRGGGALYPEKGNPSSGERKSRNICRRHREPFFFNGYHSSSPCCGDRSGSDPACQEYRCGLQ